MSPVVIPPLTPRSQLAVTGQGLLTENFSRALAATSTILIDGSVYFLAIGLRAGDLVTNIHTICTGAAATTSLAKVGLYDKTGVRLALTADLGNVWESQGQKTHALIAAYTATADDVYLVAIVCKAGTLPSMPRGTNFGNTAKVIGSGVRAAGKQTGQTDLPSPATFADGDNAYWVGVS